MQRIAYPKVRRDAASIYERCGKKIADPYAYLEDPAAEETKEFVTKQNDLFAEYMGQLPIRDKLKSKIESLMDYPKTSAPALRKGGCYFWHNTGLQNQSVMMRTADLEAKEPQVFLDPNTLSEDGTTAVGAAAWSDDESLYAYALSEKGSDWKKIHVKKAETGTDTDDIIDWVKYSGISWMGNDGFFYTRYPHSDVAAADKGAEVESAENPSVCYHKLGTAQEADIEVFRRPDQPKWSLNVEVSDDKDYLIATISEGCERKNMLYFSKVGKDFGVNPTKPEFRGVIDSFEAEWEVLGNDGPVFYMTTTKDAPNKRIISLNVDTGAQEEIVPERDSVLDFCALVKDTLLVVYLEDVKHVLYRRPISGGAGVALTKMETPIGSFTSLSCRRDKSFVSYKMSSFLLPGRSFYFNIETPDEVSVFRDDTVAGFNPDEYVTEQLFVPSDDVKVPMFVMHKKTVEPKGDCPTILYGYGGFNISLTPYFSSTQLAFLGNLNGVYAIANIRGGGEYGEKWHDGGKKQTKENCFTDFIRCGEFLCEKKYCSPKTLAIMGGSNGGLLVAACANRAPQLFRAVVCQVGVLDCYKFHKFTIGHAWRSDFGDPDVPEDFEVLQRYSPLHNLKAGVEYPSVLCLTGDHDDRVVPLHTLKYVAEAQHTNPETGGPFLARVEVSAGHGAGKSTTKRIEESADTYAFIAKEIGATWTD